MKTGSVEEVLNDILEVISRDHPATKNADYPYELSSYVGDDSDTLMYILNLGEGDGFANSLLNNMPVIISATNLLAPLDFNIHCFVIDGYRSTRTEYTHLHYYVWDVRPTEPYLPFEEYTTTSYSSPTVSQIKINWGWRSQWTQSVNDGWYTLTGRWVLDDGSDYNYYRKMIYDFALTE